MKGCTSKLLPATNLLFLLMCSVLCIGFALRQPDVSIKVAPIIFYAFMILLMISTGGFLTAHFVRKRYFIKTVMAANVIFSIIGAASIVATCIAFFVADPSFFNIILAALLPILAIANVRSLTQQSKGLG